MKDNQCDHCPYLDYDEETDESYFSIHIDQDELANLRYRREKSYQYFRMGDDYSIVKKQRV